ncbi:MAG: hypothetical protein COB33_004720 [Thiotrichaceae bacterium]|nr:hypothetical protein [Thiotrichaceae bacterium]PCI09980.1 MAG: hypothetical protein COB71_13330 [Thiotrichales bacterium]
MHDQPDENTAQDTDTPEDNLLYTNPLLSEDIPTENARAVLALLTYIDLSESTLGVEGNHGLILVLEWLRRSLAYTGQGDELAIPVSTTRPQKDSE